MNYALIENGVVTNIIWLSPSNLADFADAIAYGERPVQIGDEYINGAFYRGGEKVLTTGESELAALRAQNADMAAALAVLGVEA